MTSVWLTYHDIYGRGGPGGVPASAAMYHVSADTFKAHLDVILASGRRVVTVAEFVDDPANRADTVVLTFDDGWGGAMRLGVPRLHAAKLRATFFITSGFLGRPGFCAPAEVRDLIQAGMDVGVHGTTHRMLSSCTRLEASAEFRTCKTYLEQLLQESVHHASAPGSSASRVVRDCAAEAGLRSLCTSRPGINRTTQPLYELRRIAVRSGTAPADVARYCRDSVGRETLRWAALEVPRTVLGMRNYARLRHWIIERGNRDVLFQP